MVDVRGPGETALGTFPAHCESPSPCLLTRAWARPRGPGRRLLRDGYRSQVAASVLEAAGFADVSDLMGGYGAWAGAGMPIAAARTPPAGTLPQIGPHDAKALIDTGALLLDVREPAEWEVEHVPDALLVPMGEVSQRRGELPSDRLIVVVCRSGGRSAAVTESLRKWGLDAVNFAGGMLAWSAAGLPVITDTAD